MVQFVDGQRLQKLDFDALAGALKGSGVLSGFSVTTGTGLNIVVDGGELMINYARVSLATTTLSISTPDSTYPRKDLVYATTASTGIKTGTPQEANPPDTWGPYSATPKPPNVSSGEVALAELWVPANTTTLSSEWIIDKRHFISFYREVEPRTSDPSGAELWNGRIWLRVDL